MINIECGTFFANRSSQVRLMCEEYLSTIKGIRFSYTATSLIYEIYGMIENAEEVIDSDKENGNFNYLKDKGHVNFNCKKEDVKEAIEELEFVLSCDLKYWFYEDGNEWGKDIVYDFEEMARIKLEKEREWQELREKLEKYMSQFDITKYDEESLKYKRTRYWNGLKTKFNKRKRMEEESKKINSIDNDENNVENKEISKEAIAHRKNKNKLARDRRNKLSRLHKEEFRNNLKSIYESHGCDYEKRLTDFSIPTVLVRNMFDSHEKYKEENKNRKKDVKLLKNKVYEKISDIFQGHSEVDLKIVANNEWKKMLEDNVSRNKEVYAKYRSPQSA